MNVDKHRTNIIWLCTKGTKLIKIKINPSPMTQMPRNTALRCMELLYESIATHIIFSNRKRITTGINNLFFCSSALLVKNLELGARGGFSEVPLVASNKRETFAPTTFASRLPLASGLALLLLLEVGASLTFVEEAEVAEPLPLF
jgi:hypothetical protein